MAKILVFLALFGAAQAQATIASHQAYSSRAAQVSTMLNDEDDRQHNGHCKLPLQSAAFADCLRKEAADREGNYLIFIRGLGFLIRSGVAQAPVHNVAPIPFDAAELSWQDYRKVSCAAAVDASRGIYGPAAAEKCKSTLTLNHMHELHDLYQDYL